MKKFCRFIGLVLSVILVLGLFSNVYAVGEKSFFALTSLDELYKDEFVFKTADYLYKGKKLIIEKLDSDYLKEIFLDENFIFIKGETTQMPQGEDPQEGSISFRNLDVNVSGSLKFDNKMILIRKINLDYDEKYEGGSRANIYQGWFAYTDEGVYQKLIMYLEQCAEQEIQEIENEREKPLKNQVNVSDIEILYEATGNLGVFKKNWGSWGVCSYIKAGKRVTLPFMSDWVDYIKKEKVFFLADKVEGNIFSINNERAVYTYDGGKTGREFDSGENRVYTFSFELHVTDSGQIDGLLCSYSDRKTQKQEVVALDMTSYTQTGTLPKELFSPENNVSDVKETKSEDKKEELDVKEETPEKLVDDKKQEEKKEKDQTEKQDEKMPASDEKENMTDDTQKNEKPEEQSDEQPAAENNYPKHIQAMNDWAQPYVKRAADMGWLIEDIFSGDLQRDMRREDFCVLAEHMLGTCGIDTAAFSLGIPPFSDTQNQSVNALYRLGIVKGKNSVEFAPQDSITREEAAAILHRMCKVLEIKDVYTDYRLSGYMFADTESFSDWAAESIYNIYLHGVMQGIGDDFFDPKSPYSMEQAITTMIRLYDKKEAEK